MWNVNFDATLYIYIYKSFLYSIEEWLIVEWDTGSRRPYRFGTTGTPSDKYDVELCCEPRVLFNELIGTGCLVTRGKIFHTWFDQRFFSLNEIEILKCFENVSTMYMVEEARRFTANQITLPKTLSATFIWLKALNFFLISFGLCGCLRCRLNNVDITMSPIW